MALVIVTAALTFTGIRLTTQESVYFADAASGELQTFKRFGPGRSSRFFEEWFIRDYFGDRRDGIFLDVGASHYRDDSNTYYLEKALGWSGIAVDALAEFGADYRTHRPRTRFVAMFAADNSVVSSANQQFAERHGKGVQAREVPSTTLDAMLDEAGIKRLDFMSMDIELSEPKALAGFDIERFRPALVCIEAHPEVRQQILDYFAAHGYVIVGKYLRADPHNLYFAPRSGAGAADR